MGERICSFDGLDLRDEQLDILNVIREFVDNEIIPVAHDLEARDEYPEEIVQGLREMGLFGMRIPEEYGGLGLDLTTYALAIAELSRGWMSVAGIVNGVYIVSGMLAGHGTQEQKDHYLPKLAAGELVCCFMMTEPEAGSDVRAIRTTACSRIATGSCDGSGLLEAFDRALRRGVDDDARRREEREDAEGSPPPGGEQQQPRAGERFHLSWFHAGPRCKRRSR